MPKIVDRELPEIDLIDDKSIGERINNIRKQKGLTQQDLAEIVGIERRLISEYETGRVRIYDEMIARIAMALNVSTDILHGIKRQEITSEANITIRYTKRIKEIEKLPEHKKRAVLKTLDDSIKANKN